MVRMLLFGLGFGFILSRVGATDYTLISDMFLLRNFHLMGVIGIAIITAGIGLQIVKRSGMRTIAGTEPRIQAKPRNAGNWWGGLIFGTGWAITGTCPGTALSQLGEGKLIAAFTIAGILIGTRLYLRVGGKFLAWLKRSDSSGSASAAQGASV